jgi:hypothetical protein
LRLISVRWKSLTQGVALLAFCALGCGQDAATPIPREGVELSLTLSASSAGPGEVIKAYAVLTNHGPGSVMHPDGCSFVRRMGVFVLAPDGSLFDDGSPQPLCPDHCCVEMEAGVSSTATLEFDGTLYNPRPGPTRYAERGNYTYVVRFDATDANGERILLERRATFRWQGP